MWHKCIHMRAESWEEELLLWSAWGSALWECKPSRWTILICVYCHWWPIGKCSLIKSRSIKRFIGAKKEAWATQCIWVYFLLSLVMETVEMIKTRGRANKHIANLVWEYFAKNTIHILVTFIVWIIRYSLKYCHWWGWVMRSKEHAVAKRYHELNRDCSTASGMTHRISSLLIKQTAFKVQSSHFQFAQFKV